MNTEFKNVYTKEQIENILNEFKRLKDECYLEHTGATLYSDIQILNIFQDLKSNLYGNPHAFNISSKFTTDIVDQIRYKVLELFNTDSENYSVIFTSGATASLKLVGETFDYKNLNNTETGTFAYLEDNHVSALGMRQYADNVYRLTQENTFKLLNQNISVVERASNQSNSLFIYPAQCNFSGTKYPLSWIKKIKNGALNQIDTLNKSNWYCMLDAASYVSTNKLDLNLYKPDFVCISFYKIFGYPTGLGALLVHNKSANVLKKKYFGGGTVQMTLPDEHVFRTILHEQFEDGSLPYLSILSIRHGFETLKRLNLNMQLISLHTFSLAKYVHHCLVSMHHSNGNPVAILHHDTTFENVEHQGGIVNFNLLRDNGEYIGYSEVSNMANLYNIHLRTGCLCNPGACQRHLQLSPEDVKIHFKAGHVCGDQNDLINGYPTGAIRVSFGYMSLKEDADKLLNMIENCFVSKPLIKKIPSNWKELKLKYEINFLNVPDENDVPNKDFLKRGNTNIKPSKLNDQITSQKNPKSGELKYIFIYPIKSCAAISIPFNWILDENGLKYDRQWMIVTGAGTCLTQKQEPTMCLIKSKINLNENTLELYFPGFPNITIPLNINETTTEMEVSICQSKVCGDRVKCYDCGDEVAYWISECLQRSDLRLLRQISLNSRIGKTGTKPNLSLANQAQYLLLNTASIKYLANEIPTHDKNETNLYNLIQRFRPNFVIDCDTEFIEINSEMIEIGNFKFKCIGPCTRCQMICIDQETSEKTAEPLKTLSLLTKGKIKFGVYLEQISSENKEISINEKTIFY